MEPQIRYCKTSDGVNIACYAEGGGLPLVFVLPMPGHLQLDWKLFHEDFESLIRRSYRLIRYDFRGSGLSDRTANYTLDEGILDLEAVLASFNVDTCAILATGPSTLGAIAFAASRPERVSQLVLWEPFAALEQITARSQVQAVLALVDIDYVLFTETLASLTFGWSGERARQYAAVIRESVTQEEFRRSIHSFGSWDVHPFLSEVRAPTLIIHHPEFLLVPMDAVRELAASIPGARLIVLDRTVVATIQPPEVAKVIDEFLLGAAVADFPLPNERQAAAKASASAPLVGSGMTAILFADIADSTALTERLGDAAFRAKARDLDGALRGVIREHSGTAIEGKLLGDGVLAVFTGARQAIEAALACGEAGSHAGLPLHLGLHAGDVIREENNVYGGAVNIASRISALSTPGEVLVSDIVRGLARTSAGVQFEDRGEQELKGVGEAVRVWAVVEAAH